jgi:hypothetical protein
MRLKGRRGRGRSRRARKRPGAAAGALAAVTVARRPRGAGDRSTDRLSGGFRRRRRRRPAHGPRTSRRGVDGVTPPRNAFEQALQMADLVAVKDAREVGAAIRHAPFATASAGAAVVLAFGRAAFAAGAGFGAAPNTSLRLSRAARSRPTAPPEPRLGAGPAVGLGQRPRRSPWQSRRPARGRASARPRRSCRWQRPAPSRRARGPGRPVRRPGRQPPGRLKCGGRGWLCGWSWRFLSCVAPVDPTPSQPRIALTGGRRIG